MDRLEALLQKGLEAQSCPAPASTTEKQPEEVGVEGNHDKTDASDQLPLDSGTPSHELDTKVETGQEPTLNVKPQPEAQAEPDSAQGAAPESKSEPEMKSEPEPKSDSASDPEPKQEPSSESKPTTAEQGEATDQTNLSSNSLTSISVTNEHETPNGESSSKPNVPGSVHEVDPEHGEKEKLPPAKEDEEKALDGDSDKVIEYLATEIHRLESLMLAAASRPVRPISANPEPVSSVDPVTPEAPTTTITTTPRPPKVTSVVNDHGVGGSKVTITISSQTYNSGFLSGLPHQNSLNMLNQSQTVQPEDMASALESTIPNVVSNIFTNIQNLTESPDTTSLSSSPDAKRDEASLTSIDGSKVDVSGNTSAQITAEGEKLFQDWIEHQLRNFHLTAAMAGYIRKNAINLFRKIVRQYLERVEKMGGSVEDNVRRATQIALNNTEHLTAFLMRNYINFAGGLMQIIGEQVSRVGKQLDSTGDTISHMSLNPFDIVSNVIDSLPNPSDYSKYFRAFGKQLLGETDATTESPPAEAQEPKRAGLLKKTMGALTKTIGWLG